MVTPVRLKLPNQLSQDEKSAVIEYITKWKHNRFTVVANEQSIVPYSNVDLKHITSGHSLTEKCMNLIMKRFFVEDIPRKQVNAENVDVWIIENEYLSKGFITCVLATDAQLFAERMQTLTEFGQSQLLRLDPYVPDHLELCLVMLPDEQGVPLWYRSQFHQKLADNHAQVGLIDFGTTVNIPENNIRAFPSHLAYECSSMVCKLRAKVDLELLDDVYFANYENITVDKINPLGKYHEINISERYFTFEQDFV